MNSRPTVTRLKPLMSGTSFYLIITPIADRVSAGAHQNGYRLQGPFLLKCLLRSAMARVLEHIHPVQHQPQIGAQSPRTPLSHRL